MSRAVLWLATLARRRMRPDDDALTEEPREDPNTIELPPDTQSRCKRDGGPTWPKKASTG